MLQWIATTVVAASLVVVHARHSTITTQHPSRIYTRGDHAGWNRYTEKTSATGSAIAWRGEGERESERERERERERFNISNRAVFTIQLDSSADGVTASSSAP